jgi:hypothetical protein
MSLNDFENVNIPEDKPDSEVITIDTSDYLAKKELMLTSLDSLVDSSAQVGFEIGESAAYATIFTVIDSFTEKLESSETDAIKTLAILKEMIIQDRSQNLEETAEDD